MLGCEKRSCDQQRSSSPSPAALHLAEAASALPSLNCCCSARFVASHPPLSHTLAFSSPKRSLIFIFFLTIHDSPKHSQIQTKLLCLLMEFLQLSSALHRPPRALAVPWHCPSTLSGAEPLPPSISALGTTFLCLCITGSISFQMSSENPSLFVSPFWKEKLTQLNSLKCVKHSVLRFA